MKKNYQATFILDTHKWRDPIEALIDQVKATIEEIGGEIKSMENLGMKAFSHAPNNQFVEGQYISFICSAEPNFNALLQERMSLNPNVNRVIVENKKHGVL